MSLTNVNGGLLVSAEVGSRRTKPMTPDERKLWAKALLPFRVAAYLSAVATKTSVADSKSRHNRRS